MTKERVEPPSWQQIASYWTGRNIPGSDKDACTDSDEPSCFACGWHNGGSDAYTRPAKGLERAHVVPHSRGGSNEVDNFALLCKRCHQEAPDTADAAWFWRWVARHPYDGSPFFRASKELEEILGYLTKEELTAVTEICERDGREVFIAKLALAAKTSKAVRHFGFGFSASTKARLLVEVLKNETKKEDPVNADDQVTLAQVILAALREGGYVDPDDDTVPFWPRRSGREDRHLVWVAPTKLAADVVAALQPHVTIVRDIPEKP